MPGVIAEPALPAFDQGLANIPFDAGDVFCFQVTLLTDDGEECCTEKICFTVPECDCAVLTDTEVTCEELANGDVKYTITMTVHARVDVEYVG